MHIYCMTLWSWRFEDLSLLLEETLISFNPLAPMGDVVILKHVISEHMLWIKFMGTSHEITLRWMPQNPIDKSTLVQVMAWLTPEVIKPLPKPVLTKIPQCHMVALDHNMLTWSVKDLSSPKLWSVLTQTFLWSFQICYHSSAVILWSLMGLMCKSPLFQWEL